jgi:hypothetical protein
MKSIFGIICITTLLLSCNKEERFSGKLMKGETWVVKNVSIDGNGLGIYGIWEITTDVNIYDSVPSLTWTEQGDAVMEWQFLEKGKKFALSYVQQCDECNGEDLDDLDYLAHDLTGTYEVEKHKKKKMSFTSTNALGYTGKEVKISIERE